MPQEPQVDQRLAFVASLCDHGDSVKITKMNCVVKKKKNCVVCDGERANRMYFIKLQGPSENVLTAQEFDWDILSEWH